MGASLFPVQRAALDGIRQANGGIVYVPPGGGKTLIALLAPTVLGAQRALFLTKAGLLDQFQRDASKALRDGFPVELRRFCAFESHERLSAPSGAKMLERYKPDAIIVDEAAGFLDADSQRGNRFFQYVIERNKAGKFLPVVGLSGTFLKNSLLELRKFFIAALKGNTPIPTDYMTAEEWSSVLTDDDSPESARVVRVRRALHARDGEDTRTAFARRFRSTPGVTFPDAGALCAVPLHVHFARVPLSPAAATAYRHVESTWSFPGGTGRTFTAAAECWRLLRQVSCGFWTEPAEEPMSHREARLSWEKAAWAYCRSPKADTDSVAVLEGACAAGAIPRQVRDAWQAWSGLRGTWDPPPPVLHVLDTVAVDHAAAWAKQPGGLVWVHHQHLGRALEAAGVRYFGEGSDAELAKVDGERETVAVSISAHSEGKNLQTQGFHRNLVLELPASAHRWEQKLARTARHGQRAPAVTAEIWMPPDAPVSTRVWHKVLRRTWRTHKLTQLPSRLMACRDWPAWFSQLPEAQEDDAYDGLI